MKVLHTSVLAQEFLNMCETLTPFDFMIDCTLGEGGHSELALHHYPDLTVLGIDRDKGIIEKAEQRLKPFGSRFSATNGWFNEVLDEYEGRSPSLILFDLGISMYHYQQSLRGFSFTKDEDLDMRLDTSQTLSAKEIVNTYSQTDIANIIYQFGEERYSRRIAQAIIDYRQTQTIEKADQLASIIFHSVPKQYRYGRLDPSTRTFQALRIAVNSELDRIVPSIERAVELLQVGGLVAVMSFHSLEDRLVKQTFRRLEKGCICPPEAIQCTCGKKPTIKILTKKPIVPTEQECIDNPPSRSVKFRIAKKLEVEDASK
ncbi:MAG: 16S rRNA (cytosine(1402)-N(4))-methyltransferase RsmH [Sphaerochaetaceae bacterium]|jgi:16S rRNA (cytosine1402-N4)-methyltransferase